MRVPHTSCIVVIATLLSSLGMGTVRAQIVADRPGFADRAVTVNEGTVQVEAGYSYRDGGRSNHRFGPALMRAGLTDRLELRAGLGQYIFGENRNGYGGGAVGAKFRLLKTNAAAIAAISRTSIPISSLPNAPARVRQGLTLAFDAALSERLTVSVNSGTQFFYSTGAESDRVPEGLFLGAVGGRLTERVSTYIGYAGFYGKTGNRNWVESGLTVLAHPDTQLDVNGGVRVDGNIDSTVFVGLGLAHRF